MGMTIEECYKWVRNAKIIMRKYKKIEQIIKDWEDGTLEEKDSIYAFHEIMGVVEDGNDD